MKNLIINSLVGFMEILKWLIFIRVILSWIPISSKYRKVIQLINELTEPILEPIRRLLDQWLGDKYMVDFSPIAAFIVINLVQQIIASI